MSTMSFPSQTQFPPSDQSNHPSFYPSSYDPEIPESAFQVNPHSLHPPRTPKPSMHEEKPSYYHQDPPAKAEDDASVASSALASRKPRLHPADVWRDMLTTSAGRDKALKLIQYSLKLYVLIHKSLLGGLRIRGRQQRTPTGWEAELLQRVASVMAGLSLTRKCLLLFNWLTPLNQITQPEPLPYTSTSPGDAAPKPFLYAMLQAPPPVLIDLVNTVAEDVSTSAKLGLLKGKIGERAGRLADWTWFAGTIVALIELSMERSLVGNLIRAVESRLYTETVEYATASTTASQENKEADEKELERLRSQLYWIRITRCKLLMDLIFVSYECFRIKRAGDAVKTITGLVSGILGSAKTYDRHRKTLLKGMSQ